MIALFADFGFFAQIRSISFRGYVCLFQITQDHAR